MLVQKTGLLAAASQKCYVASVVTQSCP